MFGTLLSNCLGQFSIMSGLSRLWARLKRRPPPGKRAIGAGEEGDGFVRVEGKCKGGSGAEKASSIVAFACEQLAAECPSPAAKAVLFPNCTLPVFRIEMDERTVQAMTEDRRQAGTTPNPKQMSVHEKGNGALREGQSEEKNLSLSSVDLSSRKSTISSSAVSHRRRPSSSLIENEYCSPGKPCAKIRISVQFSQQKKLLIVTLCELAQTDDLIMAAEKHNERSAIQIRLALLSDLVAGKVQKFQSKLVPLDPFAPQLYFGETFAFATNSEQLAESVVRLRLYRKTRQKRPACLGVTFLCNYLVDKGANRAQNHFLQFRLVQDSDKGNMSLFPSMLSLHHQKSPPPVPASPSPSAFSTSLSTLPAPASPGQQMKASGSRRGSTVDESGRFCSLPQTDGSSSEVLVSLCYFDDQNRLVVGVDKAAIRKRGAVEEHDVMVRISAVSPEGQETGRHKSSCIRTSAETLFNAQAMFNVPRSELPNTHIRIRLYSVHGGKLLRRKTLIGSLSLGEEECSSPDAQTHWREMLQAARITVDKWHLLEEK